MSASAGCAAVDAGAHWVLTGGASMHDIAIRGGTIVDGAGKWRSPVMWQSQAAGSPRLSLARKTAAPVQLICPCVVGRKDLMTKFYPAAVGDTTRTRVRQSLRREDGAGIIGGASRRH